MKHQSLLWVAAILSFSLTGIADSAELQLAERHAAKGLECVICHTDGKQPAEGAEVESAACLQCHPRSAIIEKYQASGKKNPHKNHLGEVDCAVCHHGHFESATYCLNCHKDYPLKLK